MEETGEARGAFGGFIGPRTLIAQVWNTAPWLLRDIQTDQEDRPLDARANAPLGWRDILAHAYRLKATNEPNETEWLEYFALCLAAHFGTCATYVPTDVDTKIRGHLWFRLRSPEYLERAVTMAEQLASWDIRVVSARTLTFDKWGTISGHDGERLSVLGAGLLRCLAAKYDDGAERLARAIENELKREAAVFDWLCNQRGREREIALVSGNLTHNAGDLDQGFSCEEGRRVGSSYKEAWGKLAHERFQRFGGAFGRATAVNKVVMAPEAHRHYPLRRILPLRDDPRWLRPGGPFMDAWGESLSRNAAWSLATKGEVLDGLLQADKRVAGQRGYSRALVGFAEGAPGGLDLARWKPYLGTAARKHLKSAELRKKLAVTRASFEGTIANEVRAALASAT